MYGQMNEKDDRGILGKNAVANLRKTRSREQWSRFDSIIIGPGAANLSRGFFNNWVDFANADGLQWFSGRDTGAGPTATNQYTERADWAQDLYQTRIEFITPTGMADLETEANDGDITPLLFAHELPNSLAMSIILAESDNIAKAPASHFPAGLGPAYPVVSGAAAPTVIGGTNGEPSIGNSWKWPEPITLAAQSKLTVQGSIDQPLRQLFANLPGPGFRRVPTAGGSFYDLPNWYQIRVSFDGPRYLQLRGARSSA
jgi:hypothetical protein